VFQLCVVLANKWLEVAVKKQKDCYARVSKTGQKKDVISGELRLKNSIHMAKRAVKPIRCD
jgi:hypothetical protein